MTQYQQREQGAGPITIIMALVILAAVVFLGWWLWLRSDATDTPANNVSQAVRDAVQSARCDYEDAELCKFLTGWKATDTYRTDATVGTGAGATKTLYEVAQGNKYHLTHAGKTTNENTETIGIGNDYYVKTSDGTWWKQTVSAETAQQNRGGNDITLQDPPSTPAADKVAYKRIVKESCGELSCFKYQVIEPGVTETSKHIWFDDQDFQLRRLQVVNKAGASEYDAAVSYANVSVNRPSPVKDVPANQQVLPGQTGPTPTILPATGDDMTYEEYLQLMAQQ